MADMHSTNHMNWDLTPYFPRFDGPELTQFKEALRNDITSLREQAAALPALDSENQTDWEAVVVKSEELYTRLRHLNSYVSCLVAADSRNEAYLKEEAGMALMGAEYTKLSVEFLRAIKGATDEVFASFSQRDALVGVRYFLTRLREESRHTMTPDKEVLAADLSVDGLRAWGRLYDTLSGKLEFEMVYPDGRRERVPISKRRSLIEHPDRRVRRAAFEGGNAAWQAVESVAAAALNAISGTRLTLNRHRGYEHFLALALFQAAISRKTLDAMFEAIYTSLDLPRRILSFKAAVMGTPGVAWYDLGADLPLPDHEPLAWDQATALVQTAFTTAYPGLGTFVQTTYEKNWIEWEPRPGKRPGGFCTTSPLIKESRVFMTYNQSMGDVLTLAHELGHAFHSYAMRDLRPYARLYPMTLAESASTFGEMVLTNGVLDDPSFSDVQKVKLLNMETGHGAIYLMDIPVRYEFEKAFYEERTKGEISVSRLKELMVEVQQRIFGEVLEHGGEDPYFWASKLHFYMTGITFYNFPYTFGYLLSRGLFGMFKKEGADFLPRYEQFLRLTGSDTAENVVRHSIGHDLQSPEFWVEAIHSLEEPQNRLEALVPKVLGR